MDQNFTEFSGVSFTYSPSWDEISSEKEKGWGQSILWLSQPLQALLLADSHWAQWAQ